MRRLLYTLIVLVLVAGTGYCQTREDAEKAANELFNKRDYKGTITYATSALALYPDSASLHFTRGKAYLSRDATEEGLADINRVIVLNRSYLFEAYLIRIVIYSDSGRFKEAEEDLRKVRALPLTAEKRIQLAVLERAVSESLPSRPRSGKTLPRAGKAFFFIAIAAMALMAVAFVVVAFLLLPKTTKAKVCPAARFASARWVTIPLPRAEEIVIRRDSPAFTELAGNFTDETKAPSKYEVYPVKLYIKIKHGCYALEVSLDGWNFVNEERGRRVLRDPLRVMEIIDSLKEEYSNSKKK